MQVFQYGDKMYVFRAQYATPKFVFLQETTENKFSR